MEISIRVSNPANHPFVPVGNQDVMVKMLAATGIESFDILMLFGRAAWKLQLAGRVLLTSTLGC